MRDDYAPGTLDSSGEVSNQCKLVTCLVMVRGTFTQVGEGRGGTPPKGRRAVPEAPCTTRQSVRATDLLRSVPNLCRWREVDDCPQAILEIKQTSPASSVNGFDDSWRFWLSRWFSRSPGPYRA